jgi:hypothetical protein
MKVDEISHLWRQGARFDTTLRAREAFLPALQRKLVRPEPYARSVAFERMAAREAAVFEGMPILVKSPGQRDTTDTLVEAFSTKFPPSTTNRVQVGPSHRLTRLPVREIMRRWSGGRAIVGVTDLHIRGTRVEEIIDTTALSNFNVIVQGSEDLARQEMMTLVIASAGNVTDSHSDDPDGTNHCFLGKKLWLAWDTFEGIAAGLEDAERQDVRGDACAFSLRRFLSLRSSRWFTVSTGQTLFLPGSLTHKVVTLEPYLGVGSFHVGLPGSLGNLTRWLGRGPLWSQQDPRGENAGLVAEIAELTRRLAERCRDGSGQLREQWGYDLLPEAYRRWHRSTPGEARARLLANPQFAALVEIAGPRAQAA